MGDLAIDVRRDDSVVHLGLTGEFDLAGLPAFESAIAAVEEDEPATIVIDLSALTFMDSSGLRALVTADERARTAQRRLAIVAGPPTIRRVFEITKLDAYLDLVEDAASVAAR